MSVGGESTRGWEEEIKEQEGIVGGDTQRKGGGMGMV